MYINPNQLQLNEMQAKILKAFIREFLPPSGNKRKNSGNEIRYITTSLSSVFKKFFGFSLSRQIILEAFNSMQYNIYTKNGVWDWEVKDYKPASKKYSDEYLNPNISYTYIDIEPLVVRQLKLATMAINPLTNYEKIASTFKIINRIEEFKQKTSNN